MQLIEIYNPLISSYVQYRVLPPSDVDEFVSGISLDDPDAYMESVLEMVVANLDEDIAIALSAYEDEEEAIGVLESIYNGCVMLNPGFDVGHWLDLTEPIQAPAKRKKRAKASSDSKVAGRTFSMTRASFAGLSPYLKQRVIGQDQAIDVVSSALKRAAAGISDPDKPLGAFLFSGASGTGKTQLAKELQKYLFGEHQIVRIDCGEYQHKHENQKLGGAPPAYVGHENGGHLTERMKENPQTVVLLDEVEKAHRDIWDTFLRVFDEGIMIDGQGNEISFRDSIIIMTTNLGNASMVEDLRARKVGFIDAQTFDEKKYKRYADEAIRKHFRPEFVNRIDQVVYFNYLNLEDLHNIAAIEMDKLDSRLSENGIVLNYADSVLDLLAGEKLDPVEGARAIIRRRRDLVEDRVSDVLLEEGNLPKGTNIYLAYEDDELIVQVKKPESRAGEEESE